MAEKINKAKIKRALKFMFIPFYRDPEFSMIEYELGKIKSKRRMFTRFLTPLTIIGFILILFIGTLAVYPQWLSKYILADLMTVSGWGDAFAPPSLEHPLGTTDNGYDILGRLIWGARSALTVGIQANLISVIGGVLFGLISAYFGGMIDSVIMRLFDMIMAFPSFIIHCIPWTVLGHYFDIFWDNWNSSVC
jgi:ABC-type dipeptide/oligopeptide/nickel transport system permease subunit